jgi:hypothetical protein
MKTKNLKITFVFIALASLGIALGYTVLVSDRHLLLGLAITAASLSIAADPDFVLQDASRVLDTSDTATQMPSSIASRVGLLLALVCIAGWLYMNVFE